MLGCHRLAEPQRPDDGDRRQHDAHEEHGSPRSDEQDGLAHERHDDRPDQEEGGEGRDDTRHPVALVQVTGDREAEHRRCRCAEPPDEARDEQRFQSGSRRAGHGPEPVEDQAADEHTAPTEAISEHTAQQLTDRHPREVERAGDRWD